MSSRATRSGAATMRISPAVGKVFNVTLEQVMKKDQLKVLKKVEFFNAFHN